MKRFALFSLITFLLCTTAKANVNGWEAFYTYLTQKVDYPMAARSANHQGNSIITFSLINGNLKDVNIQTELGKGCDIAVLNRLMTYPQFKTIKDGKYALKVEFRLQGSTTEIINELVKMPVGFNALKTVTIVGELPVNSITQRSNSVNENVIAVRGYKTAKDPLYILDGKPVASMSELTPDNIETITILKDASAISLYGQEAKNGVIIVTSKKPAQVETITPENKNRIIIRGTNGTGNNPMYIIDGEVATHDGLTTIEPNKIDKIDVLKNASAVALYGPEAVNGVIVITTKKESSQKTKK